MRTLKLLLVYEPDMAMDYSRLGLQDLVDHLNGAEIRDSGGQHHSVSVTTLKVDRNSRTDRLADALAIGREIDQLWLFGGLEVQDDQDRLGPSAQAALFARMQSGLGIFATGDHETLGGGLCGDIPRIRHMRYWRRREQSDRYPPAISGAYSAETGMAPLFGRKADYGSNRDTDLTPKPVWFANRVLPSGVKSNALVHPLGFHSEIGRIGYLPDHMHEGTCRPVRASHDDVSVTAEDVPEHGRYEMVAWTVRRGFDAEGIDDVPVVEPIIHCFDHPSQGRIVVDSTFHHFTSSNVRAMRQAEQPEAIGPWTHCKEYPLNIVAWLSRVTRATRAPH
ncbi:hypothetical protein C7S18_15945 [Ahniella affigens]|uniref:ThuA-like domain-containing protein n=1 Tax=Ahniella affigens TaxID=2021234 RepID=A0A2P1PUS4_9GAMM|nr:hypothetical protein [Ahniella affigens]AVP98588.1 hypothetical protein C7S18_15945 [Ahniella affigens]